MVRKKQSYNTEVIILYKLSLLPKSIDGSIPDSTKRSWNRYDLSKLIGLHLSNTFPQATAEQINAVSQSMKLKFAFKVVYKLFFLYRGAVDFTSINKTKFLTLVGNIKSHFSLKKILRFAGVSLFQWKSFLSSQTKKICASSPFGLCRNKYPGQLTQAEVNAVTKYVNNPDFIVWPFNSIYFQALRDEMISFSLQTWYRLLRALGITKPLIKSRRKNHAIGIRASRPKQILHVDMTIYKIRDGARDICVHIYNVVDNFSRMILASTASLSYSAEANLSNFEEAIRKHDLLNGDVENIDVFTDDGSENKGAFLEFINSNYPLIKKIIAQVDVHYSNSIVEYTNKDMKYAGLYFFKIKNFEEIQKLLPKIVNDYNNRPAAFHNGLTRQEVFLGADPIKDGFYCRNSKKAIADRIAINQSYDCQTCDLQAEMESFCYVI